MASVDSEQITLYEFNRLIGRTLYAADGLTNRWVVAEFSDFALRGGHCYCELVDKDPQTDAIRAKIRGIIWSSQYPKILDKFLRGTGEQLRSGIKVLLRLSVNFHEQFGISLIISDIDPSYTLGDMERRRREILERLKREGVINDNRELAMPMVPQRIAIISAAGAAGYGDFINQLNNNKSGIIFYTALFEARMQGRDTAPTVVEALNRINRHADCFDCVVIIRGGGSTSDLSSFDDYNLAYAVTQCQLPVITGIGHERDNTVIDYISNLRVKTPTAAAEWLIEQGENALSAIVQLSQDIFSTAQLSMAEEKKHLASVEVTIPHIVENRLVRARSALQTLGTAIPARATARIESASARLPMIAEALRIAARNQVEKARLKLGNLSDSINILSPQNTLRRGYSITTANGKAVKSASQILPGTVITTHLADGSIDSTVN